MPRAPERTPSWLVPPSWLGAILILLFLAGGAHAQSVDWSQYIEEQPARTAPAKAPAKTKRAKQARAKKAKAVAKKGKAKKRTKARPRRK